MGNKTPGLLIPTNFDSQEAFEDELDRQGQAQGWLPYFLKTIGGLRDLR